MPRMKALFSEIKELNEKHEVYIDKSEISHAAMLSFACLVRENVNISASYPTLYDWAEKLIKDHQFRFKDREPR